MLIIYEICDKNYVVLNGYIKYKISYRFMIYIVSM